MLRTSRAHVSPLAFALRYSAFVILWAGAVANAQSGGGYNIKKSTIDSGGHSNLTDIAGTYKLGGTVGQHDASDLTGGGYLLTGGFWSPAPTPSSPGDLIWNADPLSSDRTTRSLRFRLEAPAPQTATATPGQSAIKVTMIDLQNPVPPNLPANPPPDYSGYESGTCSPMTCVGGSRNGLTCTAPADCPDGGTCTAAVEDNGCARWVGKPGIFLESQDLPSGATNLAARLQCTPYYHDWIAETASGPIAVVGAEIAPSSEYLVQAYGSSCKGSETGCTAVSAPVTMYTRRFGDVETAFCPPTCGGGTGDQPNVTDVAQLVNKFKNLAGAPVKAVAQLQPNLPELNADISALDIVAVVDAVKQKAYSFSGPCSCPSLVPCGVAACTGGTQCTPTYGVGSTCVKTCVGGDNAGDPCINDTHCPDSTCGAGFCRDRCGRCTP